LEEFLNHGSIGGTIAAKADGLDGGDDLRKPRDGVGDSRDRATKGSREKNGVEEGAMGADKENTRVVVVRVRVRFCDFWGWSALNYNVDAKGPKGVVDHVHREEGACGNAKAC